MLTTILLAFAFALALLAAVGVPVPKRADGTTRWSLGWASIACYFLSLILGSFGHLSR